MSKKYDKYVESIKKDALVMALRLLGENEDTLSPECREAMSRWRPIAMRVLSSAFQPEDAADGLMPCPYCQGPLRRLWECIRCGQVA